MSGSCPRSERAWPRARGFTLLEVLVVLALVGIMAALVAPRLQGTYEAIAWSGDRAETIRQLERLPLVARGQGRPIDVAAGDEAGLAAYLALPSGWRVVAIDPLRVDGNGVCHGGRMRVSGGGRSETLYLAPPGCGVDDAP